MLQPTREAFPEDLQYYLVGIWWKKSLLELKDDESVIENFELMKDFSKEGVRFSWGMHDYNLMQQCGDFTELAQEGYLGSQLQHRSW